MHRLDQRPRIGFTIPGGGVWAGGVSYIRNLLRLISEDLSDGCTSVMFLSPSQYEVAAEQLNAYLEHPPVIDQSILGAGTGNRLAQSIVLGSDRALADLVVRHDIDVMFESSLYFGWRFPVPVLSWIPDFQHRHIPALFSTRAWWRRELGYRLQTATRSTIMVSSHDASQDCQRFYAAARGRVRVVRFASIVDVQAARDRAAATRKRYHLPDRYIYVPNQFWRHKNHAAIVRALAHLRDDDRLHTALPIVMSGPTDEPRDRGLFERTVHEASTGGLSGWFRHLGYIPYHDVLALNAGSVALMNPSRFEGWSTTVEEAKSLGTPLLLSDLPVHREQAPNARFFDADDARSLASAMLDARDLRPRRDEANLEAANADRRREFATEFISCVRTAIRRGQAGG